jgi:AraC-like DNA-binding protein
MSNYQIIAPCIPLRQYIEAFWIQENSDNSQNHRSTTVLPTTTIDLIFIFGDPFIQLNNDSCEMLPLLYVSGQKTRFVKVTSTGKTDIIIVRFYPWGAALFFDYPMNELTNASVDLYDLVPRQKVNELDLKIREALTTAERIASIESFLLHVLDENRNDSLIFESIYKINRHSGNISITDLAHHLNLSRRQFQRRFTRIVGASPKEFAGIIRFQKALFQTRKGIRWPEIISKCGFYDQAHLIRDVKKYSGLSHERVFLATPPTSLTNSFNKNHKMSHLYNTVYL